MAGRSYFVYIVCDKPFGTLYIGVTNSLGRRMHEHKQKLVSGFSAKYGCDKLVYAESFERIEEALHRETCLKRWKRDWKIGLIKESNPEWRDLNGEVHI